MGKPKHTRSANGFILEPALILFMTVILFTMLCVSRVSSKAALISASRRHQLDLQIVEKATEMAAERSWRKRCSLSLQDSPEIQDISINGQHIILTDRTTFIEAVYQWKDQKCRLQLFYDQNGVLKIEYS